MHAGREIYPSLSRQVQLVVIDESGNGPCPWGYNSKTLRAQL